MDGRIELREGIRQATQYQTFVAGVPIFPDTRRDKDMALTTLNHGLVHTAWGLDTLQEGLERIAEEVGFHRPPSAINSENEGRWVNELQYRPAGEPQRETGQRPPASEGRGAAAEVAQLPLPVRSAAFNIRHLDKVVMQHFHLERDADGRTVFPQA